MDASAVHADERLLAGRTAGGLWTLGGATLASFAILPGIDHAHRGAVLALGAGAFAWGLIQLVAIPWRRAADWLLHASVIAGLAVIAGAVAASGGSRSPGWVYLFFIAVFVSYFFRASAAGVYLTGCVLVQAAPLAYDSGWSHTAYAGELVVGAPALVVFGSTVLLGNSLIHEHRARAELLAREQAALRRIATAVIHGEEPETLFALVAREAAALLGAGAAGVLRFGEGETATVMGAWADHDGGSYQAGTNIPVRPGGDVAQARDQQTAARINDHPPGSPVDRLGYTASIVAPVVVADRSWGALAVAARGPLTVDDEDKLLQFGALLSSAIASIDERALLANQAATDPLTGLANRRALHERLMADVSRAQRHSSTVAVALVDLDEFKQVNDMRGHGAGDDLLIRVADCLSQHARAEDTVARLGGDEFAWIMPETSREQALVAIERVRRHVSATSPQDRVTVSAGICDTTASWHPAELLRFADSALYWSKTNGRNRSRIYAPELMSQPPALQ